MSNALAATAHHEAGHAVAAVYRGIGIRRVTIAARPDSAGHVHYLRPMRGVEQIHKRGMVAMAGEAAQRRFNPRSIRRHHGGSDREQVVAYAVECTGSNEQAELMARLWEVQAREFVLFHWTVIQHVAAELLVRQTLKHEDVRRLI